MLCYYTYATITFVTLGNICNCCSLERFCVHTSISLQKSTQNAFSRGAVSILHFRYILKYVLLISISPTNFPDFSEFI